MKLCSLLASANYVLPARTNPFLLAQIAHHLSIVDLPDYSLHNEPEIKLQAVIGLSEDSVISKLKAPISWQCFEASTALLLHCFKPFALSASFLL